MIRYNICSLDSGGLSILHHNADCMSDADAQAVARSALKAGGMAEIWAGQRHVGNIFVPHLSAA